MFENYGHGEDIGITKNMLETILGLLPNCDLKLELERKLALHQGDNSIEDYLKEQNRMTALLEKQLYENGTLGFDYNFALANIDFDIGDMGLDFEIGDLGMDLDLTNLTNLFEIEMLQSPQMASARSLSALQRKFTRKVDRRLLKRLPWKAEEKEKVFAEIGEAKIPQMPNIKALRKREGLSQADFAKIYSISLSTLRAWERGKDASELACAYMRLIELWPHKVREMLGLKA